MRQKNQIELNSGTGAEGEAQGAAVREIEASAAPQDPAVPLASCFAAAATAASSSMSTTSTIMRLAMITVIIRDLDRLMCSRR
jgi:hypothetical protein